MLVLFATGLSFWFGVRSEIPLYYVALPAFIATIATLSKNHTINLLLTEVELKQRGPLFRVMVAVLATSIVFQSIVFLVGKGLSLIFTSIK